MIPDERSLGGRHAIELEHLNMRNKIVGARAMVNSRAAKQAAKPGKKKVYKDPFAEVREVRHYFKNKTFHTQNKKHVFAAYSPHQTNNTKHVLHETCDRRTEEWRPFKRQPPRR